jgi:hypothetical protein
MVVSNRSRSLELLSRRIGELDAAPLWQASENREVLGDGRRFCAQINRFMNVMRRYTDSFMDHEAGSGAMIDPIVADAIAASSRLLGYIAEREPWLNVGPLQVHRQHWTRTARDALPSGEIQAPHETAFTAPSLVSDHKPDVKPFGLGLYTSTAMSVGCSMWRAFLGPDSSMMWPQPWYTWVLKVERDIRVAEIASATKWVEFVCDYASVSDGFVYPDWVMVAQEFDAIHVTLPAIVAAQGFHFSTLRGVIPPAFWDVETTFWLRWCFSGAHLIERVDVDQRRGQ